MDNIDDSYGQIGILFGDVFEKYLNISWRELNIKPMEYFIDIIGYVIWEDYGITDKLYSSMFAKLSKSEISEVETILKTERHRLSKKDLDYHAENALTLLGSLYSENNLFDKFILIAQDMGSREWARILNLSKTAEIEGEYKIAIAIIDVATKDNGFHSSFLKKEMIKLKKRVNADLCG